MLTDENDCSFKDIDGGSDSAYADQTKTLPGEGKGHMNLRCYHPLERFGVDFLKPFDGYVNSLTPDSAPLDPLMIESPTPRTGVTANPINGHEWNPGDDLQYACSFKLPVPQPGACSAEDIAAQNPLCQDDATGQYTTTRYRAKGYPGVRELSVLKGVGDQGIVASVCPADLSDPTSQAYGYRPAIGAIIDRVKQRL